MKWSEVARRDDIYVQSSDKELASSKQVAGVDVDVVVDIDGGDRKEGKKRC